MSAEDIEIETVPGLPHELPPGETIVWQGRPQWKALAQQTFKTRWLAVYFAVFVTVRLVVALHDRQGLNGALQLGFAFGLATACLGVLYLMSWVSARATTYTITTRRIVMRIGVALPMTWNIPFKRIAAADLKVRKDGDGDIVLQLTSPNRIAWLHLWPHNQPLHYAKARPALRAIGEPAKVSALLAKAVEIWAAKEAAPVLLSDMPVPELSIGTSLPTPAAQAGWRVAPIATGDST